MSSPVSLTPEQIVAVGKTSVRRLPDVPLVYKAILQHVKNWPVNARKLTVLDYGCGKRPDHIKHLLKSGFYVKAYDICHWPVRPEVEFDIVAVSNVLNVLPTIKVLAETLVDIDNFLKPGGLVFVNFPTFPRKGVMHDGEVIDHETIQILLGLGFRNVQRIPNFGTKSSPVFVCKKRV
jgi:hypothetical protein